jgi:dipeptidyl aminopeptidase/acylaminoacyl peptidase
MRILLPLVSAYLVLGPGLDDARAQLTPSQALDRRRLDELAASPDGRVAAFTVTEPARGTERARHVFLYRRGDSTVVQFTRSEKSEWAPRLSPDGKVLAFLSDRGERTGIWTAPIDGGEARLVPTGKIAVDAFRWSPDGRSIAFLGRPAPSDSEEAKDKAKDDARVVDRDSLAALWTVAPDGRELRRLTRPPWKIDDFAWFPDGRRLALIATDTAFADRWTERLAWIGPTDSVPTTFGVTKGPMADLHAVPDGVSFLAARDDGPIPHDLWFQPLDGRPAMNLTGPTLDRPVESVHWVDARRALLVVQEGFESRIEWIDRDGGHRAGPALPVHPSDAIGFGTDLLLVIGERTSKPAELWLVNPAGGARAVSDLNRTAAGRSAVEPVRFRYRSFDRTEVEAALLVPPDRPAGQRVPLVVVVHGGPTGAWSDRYDAWGQILVSRGYAVLYPNLRGSTGYGWKFLTANRADWGGGDFRDLMVGVDTVIGRGLADPERLGIAGWSYGGYMASWAITQTNRFKAAVTGAGMSDLAVEYGTEQGPAYDEWFYGTPYDRPDGFRKSSPLTYITAAHTPTLILQGEADLTDPVSQSQLLYRALTRRGVPAELVLYPREGHGLREENHLIDRLNRIADWFNRWFHSAGAAGPGR